MLPAGEYWDFRACGAATGCRLSQFGGPQEVKRVEERLRASSLHEQPASGHVLTHQKFRVAVAGCANCCSEPQIRDFALVAVTRPGVTEEPCTDCRACVKACPDRAITLKGGPVIDRTACLDCGMCIRVCPTGTLAPATRGVKVLVGGRLGRRPVLARTLVDLVSLDEGLRLLDACISFYLAHKLPRERFSALIDRVGLEALRQASDQEAATS
ncbi:MAG: 4Fe-4S binding protein [Bacillota bacterium]